MEHSFLGSTKSSVQKILDEWKWQAKPMHPAGKSQDNSGLLWHVLSAGPPPATVFALSHGDVLLNRVDDPKLLPSRTSPLIEASKKTRAMLGTPKVDPLQANDPWAKPSQDSSKFVTQAHLEALSHTLEARLLSKVMSKSDDVSMDTGLASRVEQLEAQMQQIAKAQSQQATETQTLAGQVKSLTNRVEAAVETKLTAHLAELDNLLSKRLKASHNERE